MLRKTATLVNEKCIDPAMQHHLSQKHIYVRVHDSHARHTTGHTVTPRECMNVKCIHADSRDNQSQSCRVRRALKTTRWVRIFRKWVILHVRSMHGKRERCVRRADAHTHSATSGGHARCILTFQHISHDKLAYMHACLQDRLTAKRKFQ